MGIATIGFSLLGIAGFFGLYRAAGIAWGKYLAVKEKRSEQAIKDRIEDPEMERLAIEAMRKANDIFMSDQGAAKMQWAVSKILPFFPVPAARDAVQQFLQGVYDSYKDEIKKDV